MRTRCRRALPLTRSRVEIEQALVHAAELLDAEVAVGDALPYPPRASRRQRQQRLPHRAIVERHAVGERRIGGENRRPLNGVTRSAPMRQPRCASRAMACSVSHNPRGRG